MNKKIIIWTTVIVVLILSVLFSFNIIKFGGKSEQAAYSPQNYQNIPQECRPPPGQDIEAWKEHLSHHAETQPCLRYFK